MAAIKNCEKCEYLLAYDDVRYCLKVDKHLKSVRVCPKKPALVPVEINHAEPCEDFTEALETKLIVEQLLEEAGLTDREKTVLREVVVEGHSLKKTGEELGLSQERVRQIKFYAFRKCLVWLKRHSYYA